MLGLVNEFLVLIVAAAIFLFTIEAAFRLGRRQRDREVVPADTHVSALQAASFGLLGLLLAFTFSMSISRHENRKSLVVEEANAIGTTVLRAGLLAPAQREQATQLLRRYTDSRLEFYDAGIDRARFDAANATSLELEAQLWSVARAALAQDAYSLPASLFTQSLNEMIDLNERRRQAVDDHVPDSVFLLLITVAAGALGFVSYASGLTGRRRHASTFVIALLVLMVFLITLDLDRPRRGLIRVSQQSMLRLRATFESSPASPQP